MQTDYAAHGAYRAGRRRVTVRHPNNTTFTAQLYYPATATGDNTPYDGSGAPYPAVSFGHGFLQPPERYRSILEHLATWGYLTIATESGLELFPNHRAYAEDMRHCLTYLEEQNADPASWLFGQVATAQFGVSGHSMGGGASILAAAADARIKAVANLAAAETNPSAIQASRTCTSYLTA
jgi:dienelactone hydrolase